ncbi:OmpA family protein [Desulfoplanes formicivorans]|uniref:Membrane protein n=1 Tax=Desulfoplanes formicivorans TaxID=1592317 RepID=A0A194AIE3_9BACT|nr:OmpA family protein [Desulfoplanes formicivorans]GAU09852.1 membrane protein [Desulfoplanes formicivorans]
MKWFVRMMVLLWTLPVWASGDYFASDRQAIVEGLTAAPRVDSRGHEALRNVRTLRVCPSDKGTEMVEINVSDQVPRVQMRIQFATNADVLDRSSLPMLRELGAALHDSLLEGKPVRIAGHTDSDGDAGYNLELSLRRARRVADWLATHANIDARNFQIVALAKGFPWFPIPVQPTSGKTGGWRSVYCHPALRRICPKQSCLHRCPRKA